MRLNLFGSSDSHEFRPLLAEIEDRPVSPLGRIIFWLVAATIVFTILWLFIGQVDVVISARGSVIPSGEVKIIQPLDTGVISKILVEQGDVVKKGQVLMEIDPSTTQPALASLQNTSQYTQLEMDRLHATVSGQSFSPSGLGNDPDALSTQEASYQSNQQALQNQVNAKQQQLKALSAQISGSLVERQQAQTLLNQSLEDEKRLKPVLDIIPKEQYLKVENEILAQRSKISELNEHIAELRHQQSQTQSETAYIRSSEKSKALQELSEKQKQAMELTAKIQEETFKNQKQSIISPVDGTVDSLMIHTIGGVVTPAQKLIAIVPDNAPVKIKAAVLNKDIGFVTPGMPVAIKVDTFDFQKYGLLSGKVTRISKDSHKDEKEGMVYEVEVVPITKSLLVEGKRVSISPGMTTTVEIKVGKRRIIEFFIYPMVKYWKEGISVR